MEDEVNSGAGAAAGLQVADIPFDEREICPGRRTDQLPHLVEIGLFAGGEIIETDHRLAETQQLLKNMTADKTGTTGHQPGATLLEQLLAEMLISCGHYRLQ